jgi:hypothetical protein
MKQITTSQKKWEVPQHNKAPVSVLSPQTSWQGSLSIPTLATPGPNLPE